MTKRKVLHVLSSNKMSGAENVAADICMMFQDSFEMAYCSPDGEIDDALHLREVVFLPLKTFNVPELKRVIKTYQPDIIHAHDFRAILLSALVTNRPIVAHLHSNSTDLSPYSLKAIMLKLLLRRLAHIITVSKGIVEHLGLKKQTNVTTLVNVIYPNRIQKLIQNEQEQVGKNYEILYCGRITEAKDPERVAKVAAGVLGKHRDFRMGIIGSGEHADVEAMKAVFQKAGVSNQVDFLGFMDVPYRYVAEAKVLLMCSRFEGTPLIVLEAMSVGTPLVSTPLEGIVNIYCQDPSIAHLSDDDEELVRMMEHILIDDTYRKELSDATEAYFNRINQWQNYRQKLEAIYISCMR